MKKHMHLKRFRRSVNGFTLNDMDIFMYNGCLDQSKDSSNPTSSCQLTSHGISHSWVLPQSTLPMQLYQP
ncbi:hypothetical protein ACS0TY_015664 [Phlomoides rotata]